MSPSACHKTAEDQQAKSNGFQSVMTVMHSCELRNPLARILLRTVPYHYFSSVTSMSVKCAWKELILVLTVLKNAKTRPYSNKSFITRFRSKSFPRLPNLEHVPMTFSCAYLVPGCFMYLEALEHERRRMAQNFACMKFTATMPHFNHGYLVSIFVFLMSPCDHFAVLRCGEALNVRMPCFEQAALPKQTSVLTSYKF